MYIQRKIEARPNLCILVIPHMATPFISVWPLCRLLSTICKKKRPIFQNFSIVISLYYYISFKNVHLKVHFLC